jgi:ParB-like chromosome segregation protein Spo0J
MIQRIEKNKLRINPLSFKIYGEFSLLNEDDASLFASIQNEGILEPIIITKSNLVISGNRRLHVALCLNNIKEIPVIIKDLKESEIDEYLVIQYNQQRTKNVIQVAREFELIRDHFGIKQGHKDKEATLASKTAQETLLSEGKTSESTIKRVLRIKKVKTNLETLLSDKNTN